MARITRIAKGSRQYLAFQIQHGLTDTDNATVEVALTPVLDWEQPESNIFSPAVFGISDTDNATTTVQVLVGTGSDHDLDIGLYKVIWRITTPSERTIVAGSRYLEIHQP